MMKVHRLRLGLMSLAAMATFAFGSSVAQADVITFADGFTGQTANINTIDFSGGNTLSVGGLDATTIGATTNTYYQSSVGDLKNNGKFEFAGSLNSTFFLTAMFGVTEQVTAFGGNSDGTVTAKLGLAGTQSVNYFNLYAQNTTQTADDHLGTGFHDGTLIYSGIVTSLTSTFTDDNKGNNNVTFDNSGGTPDAAGPTSGKAVGTPPGGGTNSGTGSFNITVESTYANPSWFPNLTPATILFVLPQGSLVDQFTVNPSENFDLGAGPGTGLTFTPHTPVLGTVDGLTPALNPTGQDFQFQTNASATFATTPEPASVTLMVIGLGGLSLAVRRRKAKNQK